MLLYGEIWWVQNPIFLKMLFLVSFQPFIQTQALQRFPPLWSPSESTVKSASILEGLPSVRAGNENHCQLYEEAAQLSC